VEEIPTGAVREYHTLGSEAAHVARRLAVHLPSFGGATVPYDSEAARRAPVERNAPADPGEHNRRMRRNARLQKRGRR
jgi:hypothetical protein